MRTIILFAAAAGLAACGPTETETVEEPQTEVEAETEVMGIDGKPVPGTYRVTGPDGITTTEVVNADGTFTSTAADGTTQTGRWTQTTPDTYCATPDAEGTEETCYTETIDENGVWTATAPDGAVYKVERIEG